MKKQKRLPLVAEILAGVAVVYLAIALIGLGYISPLFQPKEGRVWPHEVCRMQGHSTAATLRPWDPYSWYCYDLGWSLMGPVGVGSYDLKVEPYCWKHYNTGAELVGKSALGWKCIRR